MGESDIQGDILDFSLFKVKCLDACQKYLEEVKLGCGMCLNELHGELGNL